MIFRNVFDEISSLVTFFMIFHSIFVNQRNVDRSFLSLKFSQKDRFDLNMTSDVNDVNTTKINTTEKLINEKEQRTTFELICIEFSFDELNKSEKDDDDELYEDSK